MTRVLFALLVMMCGALAAAAAESAPAQKRVLIISSYHPAFGSFFPQIEGVRAGLAAGGIAAAETVLDFEYMDTKRFPPRTQIPYFLAGLRRTLAILDPYDVIIAADDNAFDLAVAHQATLLHDRPVVFLGVDNREAALRQNHNPRVTGVVEEPSSDDTFALMERLYPLGKRIVVITDATSTGASARARIRAKEHLLKTHKLEMLSLADLTYDEFYLRLAALPASVPVFFLSAYRDKNGNISEFPEVLSRVKAAFKGGIFVTQRYGIGQGVLGGDLVDHRRQGLVAGEMAARILSGTPVSSLPVVEKSPNTMTIDYAEARRLGFSERDFPPGTEFVNFPVSYYGRYRDVILLALAVAFGQAVVIFLLVRNIRRRREAEKASLAARTSAEIANKAKTEFLANMSHELRTPLNSIIGFADVMIADRVGAIGPEKRAEYLSDIRESGQHLLELLNNILDVAKIEMGKLEMADAEIDVAHALKLCQRLVAERAAAGNTRIFVEVPDDLPRLRADATRLKQSVLNLMSNAIKFSDGGGTITVSAAINGTTGNMEISVADDGPGIPEVDIAWILEPFNRGRGSGIAAKEGSGLGLPLTANLMQGHGGTLKIASTVGVGTTATLVFPADRVLPPPAERHQARRA